MDTPPRRPEAFRIETIDRRTPIPLYYQIAQHLRNDIRERGLRPGDLLGTEEEIQESFQVSRATARKALEELLEEGLVTRITGKGTYVAKPRLAVQLPALLSFSAEMKRLGMKPSSRVIDAAWITPDEEVALNLMIEEETQVFRLERVRYSDESPMTHAIDYLPTWVGLRPDMDYTGSLYEILENVGIPAEESLHTIEATTADPALASHLDVPLGSPLLRCRDIAFDAQGRPLIFGINVWRGDRYSYQVRLKRPPSESV
jgi:GntR family transcriptional regulator